MPNIIKTHTQVSKGSEKTTVIKKILVTQDSNIESLRRALLEGFNDLNMGVRKAADMKEINNTAGKIINTVRAELEHQKMLKTAERIPFLSRGKLKRKS